LDKQATHVDVADDDCQEVVEVVRDAADANSEAIRPGIERSRYRGGIGGGAGSGRMV